MPIFKSRKKLLRKNSNPSPKTVAKTTSPGKSVDTTGTSQVETPLGGVMTEQVGCISGEIVIKTWTVGDRVHVTAGYVDAAEDPYTVEGSPVIGDYSHSQIVKYLTADNGLDEDDNPRYTTLKDLK